VGKKCLASVPRFRRVIVFATDLLRRLARLQASVCIGVTQAARGLKFVRLRAPPLSDTSHQSWREVYALARQEKDPARIPEICARARRLIQNRQLELATFNRIHDDEIAELEAALRDVWAIEQKKK
jgi:hypothetical protein